MFQLHPPHGCSEEDTWKIPFMMPWQPTKFSDLENNYKKDTGLLKKHFCKMKFGISSIANWTAHSKSMGTIHCHSSKREWATKFAFMLRDSITKNICKVSLLSHLVSLLSHLWFQRRRALKILRKFTYNVALASNQIQ